jgi:hypothetical protein
MWSFLPISAYHISLANALPIRLYSHPSAHPRHREIRPLTTNLTTSDAQFGRDLIRLLSTLISMGQAVISSGEPIDVLRR